MIVAFRQEIDTFLNAGGFRQVNRSGRFRFHLSNSMPDIVVSEGGFRAEDARESVSRTVAMFKPDMIICAGFAAGAKEGHDPGTVVIGDRIVTVEGPTFTWQKSNMLEVATNRMIMDDVQDAVRTSKLGYSIGSCMTVPVLISNPAMKRWIGATYNVSTIDMESYWVAEEASRHNVPCLPVRVVLDPVEQDVSHLVGASLDDTRLKRAFRSARYLIAHPADVAGLVKLSFQVRKASGALSNFLTRLSCQGFAVR